MSLDYLNDKNSNFKAIGCFIFGGSASIGVMNAGFYLDRVLEMTDNMTELNAYHFSKNFKNIPIVGPSEWENEEYLNELQKKDYDIFISNCPCSSLSQINRKASVDGDRNKEFYRVFSNIKHIKPKSFVIENAPTLIKLGYPIILDMIDQLSDTYKFTIIRDYAGNHEVAMKRMRTLLVGWRKDVFNNTMPLVHMNKIKQFTADDAIGDLCKYQLGSEEILNHIIPKNKWESEAHLFSYVKHGTTIMQTLIDNWDKLNKKINNKNIFDNVLKNKNKIDNGNRIWDKSPHRMHKNMYCPSMTSLSNNIHPDIDRLFTIREYARLMNYPDDFEFFDECKVDVIQCIAQGVPANFIKYISNEVKGALLGNREKIKEAENSTIVFQHHTHGLWKNYNINELKTITGLDSDKSFNKLII